MASTQFVHDPFSGPADKLRAALAARTARRQLTWTQGVQAALDELLSTLRQPGNILASTSERGGANQLQALLDRALHLSNRVRTAVINFRSSAITPAKLAQLHTIQQQGAELAAEIEVFRARWLEAQPARES